MSTKDLFNRKYVPNKNEKDAFDEVESSRNLKTIRTKQDTFLPQVDYTNPAAFAKFGSARLYYESAISRILNFYPYDGSDAEINHFYNKSLDIEKYIFNSRYPRTNGYAVFSPTAWGTATARNGGYGSPSTNEYITFKAGPNSISQTDSAKNLIPDKASSKFQYSNIYDDNLYVNNGLPSDYGSGTRTSNLKSNFDTGVTVEFWAKTGSLATSLTEKQVIADIWNNELSSSAHYGRITVELDGTAGAATPWRVTVESGSTSIFQQAVGADLSIDTLNDWKHYGFVLQNSGSDFHIKLYVNGQLNNTRIISSKTVGELNPENLMGRIGALQTAPKGLEDVSKITNYSGAGKLSGSLDEFRFWKVARNAKQIGQNWFTQIRGGVNTDISNTTLGMYYKFNEGITSDSSVDSVVLDYGGRICNGVWTGYSAPSRNTGSAIVSASAASSEFLDPIVYANHPDVISLQSELRDLGTNHDAQNNAMFLKNVPSWVLEEAETVSDQTSSDLERVTHIMGAYFDKLYLQIQALPSFRHGTYTSSSSEPVPFAQHLPQSLGLYTPELFIDADILEIIGNRTDTTLFEEDLYKTRNLIYKNIYNNLASIFKSKGTERSIRNVLRCFNIDDNLVYVSAYSNNQLFEIQDNLKQTQKKRRLLNLNKNTSTTAVVYQAPEPGNVESRGFISGSEALAYEDKYGFTAEVGVRFPKFVKLLDEVDREAISTVSLFGMHSASIDQPHDTTIFASDKANFQVQAIRDSVYSKNVYFRLSSSVTPFPIPLLTTSLYYNVYDDEDWNLSVALRPPVYPYSSITSGSEHHPYDVVFRGYNNKLGSVNNSFELSASVDRTTAKNFLRAAKRLYVGATNENITGSNNTFRSDVLYTDTRYWTKFLESYTLKQHAVDRENFGISGSYRSIDAISEPVNNQNSYNFNSLALNWYYQSITGSDASGEFYVTDLSSGSALIRDNFGWAGQLGGYAHTARGKGFAANETDATINKIVNEFKFVEPEQAVSSDMVKVLSEDDQIVGTFDQVPNYVFLVEKSLYRAISEEILDFFAGSIDFNNLIGDPVNRYRMEYKGLNYLRNIFFQRINDVTTVERYVDYYKWFDDSIASIIGQLIPASAEFVNDVYNTVESHVLERNKYQSRFPTIEFKQKDPEASIRGVVESKLRYEADLFGGVEEPPTDLNGTRPTDLHVNFWEKRSLPGTAADPEHTSDSAALDTKRRTIRQVKWSRNEFSASMPVLKHSNGSTYTRNRLLETQKAGTYDFTGPENFTINRVIKGGVNFETAKDIHYTYTSLYPAGPVYAPPGGVFVPQNVLFAETEEFNDVETDAAFQQKEIENVGKKRKRHLKVTQGRDFTDGLGYTVNKNSFAFPFNVISASITGGVDDMIRLRTDKNITIANLHNDSYGPDMEIPMQGPFTNYAVGGHQSRHVTLNSESADRYYNRPEAWKLLLGKRDPTDPSCSGVFTSGAIGMTAPDYPWPEANATDVLPYPMTASQKAVYYRDFIAKRPVNIRNIQLKTGSTILGNYQNNYEVVHTFGASENPRQFIENQPQLPPVMFELSSTSSTQGRTYLDARRLQGVPAGNDRFTGAPLSEGPGHYESIPSYNTSYLSGTRNRSVIVSRFSAIGGLLTEGDGYRDFRSNEFSVYNNPDYTNIMVTRPSQVSTGQISEPTGAGTPGIRVSDIHGLDFGLTAHASRHTARFGRDSNLVTNPGATYEQLPGFHKIHRNNKDCVRIATDTPAAVYEGSALHNTQGARIQGGNASPTFVLTASHDASSGKPATRAPLLLNAITGGLGNGFSWTGILKFHTFEGHTGVQIIEPIWSIGVVNSSTELVQLRKVHASSGDHRHQIHFRIGTTGADAQFYQVRYDFPADTFDLSGNFNHIALTYNSVPDTKLQADTASQAVTLYLNGISQSFAAYESLRPNYRTTTGTKTNYRNFAPFTAFDSAYMNIGGDLIAANSLNATVDEFTFWTTELDADEISEIYNSGVPCDITSSAVYAASASALWDWIRFETTGHEGASYMQLNSSNPGTFINSNSLIGYLSSSFTPMAVATAPLSIVTDTSVPAGCTPTVVRYDDIRTFATHSLFDNLNIQHQIPRSSKQYAWITSSLVSDNGICGFYRPDFMRRVSSSAGFTFPDAYDFVTASQIGSSKAASDAGRILRRSENITQNYLPQTTRLNLNVREDIDVSTNTLIPPTTVPSVITSIAPVSSSNRFLNWVNPYASPYDKGGLLQNADKGAILNSLMFKRGNQFGYPSWKQVRQQDHQILTRQRLDNRLNIFTTGTVGELSPYDLRPVSMVGRPSLANIDYTDQLVATVTDAAGNTSTEEIRERTNITLKSSYNNEYVLFNDKKLDQFVGINFDPYPTPFEQIVALKDMDGVQLNWVLYGENVFPSLRNEFATYATNKIGYSSGFWRDSQAVRVSSSTGIPNSVGVEGWIDYDFRIREITQSIWPLDAPLDFETRTGPPKITNTRVGIGSANFYFYFGSSLITSNSAGELQNTYTSYHFNRDPRETGESISRTFNEGQIPLLVKNGALYARKQMLASPLSINNPAGIRTYVNPFGLNPAVIARPERYGVAPVPTGSGEAKWEAGRLAGYLTTSLNIETIGKPTREVGFVSAASEPFYDSYDDFRADLKFIAKGYSVLPEFRISEHISDYATFGVTNAEKHDTFDIPGTTKNSSQTEFYKDFSNSDFLEHFLDVRQMSNLTSNEIKLTCKAAIKFHPYKGFYPAQRALDLVSQFAESYGSSVSSISASGDTSVTDKALMQLSYARPLMAPLFAPGILFNSIKSGLAVDYPIITEGRRVTPNRVSGSSTSNLDVNHLVGASLISGFGSTDAPTIRYVSGAFWDKRVSFEAIMNPAAHIAGINLPEIEPHPSMSFAVGITASLTSPPSDNIYTLMASNYFAEVGKFFLKDRTYTRLQSKGVSLDNLKFRENEIYGARLRIKASHTGSRTYNFESGSDGTNNFYGPLGALNTGINFGTSYPILATDNDQSPALTASTIATSGTYELPQDPTQNPDFKRNFTMYSRTTAFGPPVLGRNYFELDHSFGVNDETQMNNFAVSASNFGAKDSLNGFNWSFTPPYYDGEAWVDFIFTPSASVNYDLNRILAETKIISRRFDPGDSLMRGEDGNVRAPGFRTLVKDRLYAHDDPFITDVLGGTTGPRINEITTFQPYSGEHINDNAMQLTASINIFGVEDIPKTIVNKFGQVISDENEIAAQRWVIQPKFETPMMNFHDTGVRPITDSINTLTLPQNFGSESVPRGMWHQFGLMPEDNQKGIFLEMGDIPEQWLKNHYEVIGSSSVYNRFDGANGVNVYKEYKSFADLMGFTNDNSSVRLGDVADKQTIREAVVAVPYIVDGLTLGEPLPVGGNAQDRKKFFSIPQYRVDAALSFAQGTATGDTLDAAGQSIRRQIQKMRRYVFPPQFDFLNSVKASPVVMYIFEFKYELDKNDLSYIWQNLSPKDSSRVSLAEDAIAHEIVNTELLSEKQIMLNPNLRWMVFKVKQKSQALYEDITTKQINQPAGQTTATIPIDQSENYPLRFNWPYDYVSIVESVNIDTHVLFKDRVEPEPGSTEFIVTPSVDNAGVINSTLDPEQRRNRDLVLEQKRSEFGANANNKKKSVTKEIDRRRFPQDPRRPPPSAGFERGPGTLSKQTSAGEAGSLGGRGSGLGGSSGENSTDGNNNQGSNAGPPGEFGER